MIVACVFKMIMHGRPSITVNEVLLDIKRFKQVRRMFSQNSLNIKLLIKSNFSIN